MHFGMRDGIALHPLMGLTGLASGLASGLAFRRAVWVRGMTLILSAIDAATVKITVGLQ
jgi:hypothetical protein